MHFQIFYEGAVAAWHTRCSRLKKEWYMCTVRHEAVEDNTSVFAETRPEGDCDKLRRAVYNQKITVIVAVLL